MGHHYDTVGETYVPGNVATQKFIYKQGQSSALGVGWSLNGGGGSFSNIGTFGWSASFREEVA